MIVTKVRARNFRSIEDTTLTLHSFTVLTGENNVGKTNILQALNHFFDPSKSFAESDLNRQAKRKFIQVIVHFAEPTPALQKEFGIGSDDGFSIAMTYRFGALKEYLFRSRISSKAIHADDLLKFFKGFFLYVPSIRDLETHLDRRGNAIFADITKALLKKLSAFQRRGLLRSAELGMQNINRALQRELGDLLRTFSEHLPEKVKVRLDTTPSLGEIVGLLKLVITDTNGTETNLESKGQGFHSLVVISLFSHVMSSRPQKGLLAIEEPELHLHPNLQRVLFRLMRKSPKKKGVQMICSTHSTYFIKQCELGNIANVRRTINGTAAYQPTASFRKRRLREIEKCVTEAWSELFYSRLIVLVEGPSECTSLPLLASRTLLSYRRQNLPCTFANWGISVYPVGSRNNFQPFFDLLSQFRLPWVAVFDRDALSSQSILNQAAGAKVLSRRDAEAVRSLLRAGEITKAAQRLRKFNLFALSGDYEDFVCDSISMPEIEKVLRRVDRKRFMAFIRSGPKSALQVLSECQNEIGQRIEQLKKRLGIVQAYPNEERDLQQKLVAGQKLLFDAAAQRSDVRPNTMTKGELIKTFIRRDKVRYHGRIARELPPNLYPKAARELIDFIIRKTMAIVV